MHEDPRTAMVRRALREHQAGRINRRRLAAALGALGLSAAAAPWLTPSGAAAKKTGAHAGHMGVAAAQEGAPAAATPTLGEQPNGSFTHKVIAGGGKMEEMIDLLAFFPTEITVNAGDSVYWELRGFHNVHFLSGAPLPQVIVPATAMAGSGSPAASPAGGPPQLVLNPDVAFPSGGTTYDGTGVVNSGVPLDPSAPPFVLSFTAPGEYEYYCTVHGEVMEGRVVVQEEGKPRPMDQAAIDRQATEEMNALLEQARTLVERQGGTASPAADVPEVLAGVSQGQIEVNAFFPRELTISAGDTVRFVNPTTEPPVPHTVTFVGGGEAVEFIVPQPSAGGPPVLALNPELVAPVGGSTYDGRGYANSGLLIAGGGPTTYELTFDTPGTYRYYCALHGDPEGGMVGDVVVE